MTADDPPSATRRRFLTVCGTAVATVSGCASERSEDDPSPSRTTVGLERLATGFASPVAMDVPPGDTERLFVVDQPGRIRVYGPDGLREEPFLDIEERVVDLSGYDERGLLGLAFHPRFRRNRRFFVRYSAPPRAGTPEGYSHTFVLSEFRAADDGLRARRESERPLLEVPEPQSNHNAGAIAFGPDGYLYVGVGDGGGGGDRGRGHVEDWYEGNPGGNGQDVTENLLGSVLRIDVDGEASRTSRTGADGRGTEGDGNYAIPEDNPLVGRDGLDEHYAWGFRNPWRMSFNDGRLFVADVGQSRYEEVSIVERGGNYGWNVREGTHCYGADSCPSETPDGDRLRSPIIEYPHAGSGGVVGKAVVGGYVYRRSAIPELDGAYVFGDWSSTGSGGAVFAATPSDEGLWRTEKLEIAGTDDGELGRYLLSFGRDDRGRLYLLTSRQGTGALHRLVPPDA